MPPASVFVLNGTPLARNITSPVGVPALELTVAVNVTFNPAVDGFDDDARVVVVGAAVMSAVVSVGSDSV